MAAAALHVLVYQDGDRWFAQGVERDILASAPSRDKIRRQFERVLAANIHAGGGGLEGIGRTPRHEIARIISMPASS